MNTLVEFMTFIKGTEYLLVVAFLFGFIAFWQLVFHTRKGLVLSVVSPLVIALCFAILAARLISAKAVTTPSPPRMETPLLCSSVLVEMYGPSSFDHALHEDIAGDCTLCHHHSGDRIAPCKECHAAPFTSENLDKPGLARAYHLRCISCHKENQEEGPTDCTGCHTQAAVAPLSIAHAVTGVEDCLSCHRAGVSGVPKMPDDHAGATNGVCQLCHKLAPEITGPPTRDIPHEVVMRARCLLCHGEGVAGASKIPADHVGTTEESCLLCHKPYQAQPLASK